MIYVVMLEPETAGNVGAVARVMKNFDFHKLVLINPHCDHLSSDSRNRAKHSQEILDDAEVSEFFIVDDYDYLVATTALIGTDYNISRSPLLPEELAGKLKALDPSKKIGLVIGREGHGLFNEEIEKCDFVVTIPSAADYYTLNVSHAVSVILYELHKVFSSNTVSSHIAPIGKSEKDQITRMFTDIFDKMRWETAEKRETQEKLWKRIVGKAMLTNREAYGLMGFLRKVIYLQETKSVDTKPVKGKVRKVPKKSDGKKPVRTKNVPKKNPAVKKVKGASVKESISKKGALPKKYTKAVSATRGSGKAKAARGSSAARAKPKAKAKPKTKATRAKSPAVRRAGRSKR